MFQDSAADVPGIEDPEQLSFKITAMDGKIFIFKALSWFEKTLWVSDFIKTIQQAPKIEVASMEEENVELP